MKQRKHGVEKGFHSVNSSMTVTPGIYVIRFCWTSGHFLLLDNVGGLHAGYEVVVHVTVQQPLTSHGRVHPDSLEDAGEELGDVPDVATVLEHDDVVAVEVYGVDVDLVA